MRTDGGEENLPSLLLSSPSDCFLSSQLLAEEHDWLPSAPFSLVQSFFPAKRRNELLAVRPSQLFSPAHRVDPPSESTACVCEKERQEEGDRER